MAIGIIRHIGKFVGTTCQIYAQLVASGVSMPIKSTFKRRVENGLTDLAQLCEPPHGNREKVYQLDGIAGTAKELYSSLTKGLRWPPTFGTFKHRLCNGERDIQAICRPGHGGQFAQYQVGDLRGNYQELYAELTRGILRPPSLGVFRQRLQRGVMNPAKLVQTVVRGSAWRKRPIFKPRPVERPLLPPVTFIPQVRPNNWLDWRAPRYFRPGSLDAWSRLKQAHEDGKL
jgi:hypothetical protein